MREEAEASAAQAAAERDRLGITSAEDSIGANIVAGDDERVEELVDRVRETLGVPRSETTTAEEGAGEGEGADAGRDEPTLRSRAEDRIKLFQDLFGADEPSARDRAMQFAMIGLAVAAGQSPNALTNVASGLLAGTEAMSEQESARREQERGLRTSAVQSVLDELAAQREAAARAGTSFQDTESYVDAVTRMTELLIKEESLSAEAARVVAESVYGPLYGVSPPTDEPPPAGVPPGAQTAQNRQTGEVVYWDGSAWVPVNG